MHRARACRVRRCAIEYSADGEQILSPFQCNSAHAQICRAWDDFPGKV